MKLRTIDTGYTSFSLLIPKVNLGSAPAQLSTYAVTTTHRFGVVAAFNKGQTESYSVVHLTGTAQAVVF